MARAVLLCAGRTDSDQPSPYPTASRGRLSTVMAVHVARPFCRSHRSHRVIHQDQLALVTEAIRQVVADVRDPDTWYDLA